MHTLSKILKKDLRSLLKISRFDLFENSYANFLQKAIVHGFSIQAIIPNCIKVLRVNVWTTHQTYDIISIQESIVCPIGNTIGYKTVDWGSESEIYTKTVKFLEQICLKLVNAYQLGITAIDIIIDKKSNLYVTDICVGSLFDFSLLYHSICQTISGGFSKYENNLSHLNHFVGINCITTQLFQQTTYAELLNFFKRSGIVYDSRDRYITIPLLFDILPSSAAFSIIILGMYMYTYTVFC